LTGWILFDPLSGVGASREPHKKKIVQTISTSLLENCLAVGLGKSSSTSILVCKSYHLTRFFAVYAREGADGKSSYSLTIGIMAGGLGCCFIATIERI
jgi:hypothetical protein